MSDFANMDNATLDFETWETKKLKIFLMFQSLTDDQEIMIDERKDRNTDRILRMGTGKSRIDMLNLKPGTAQAP